MVHQMRTIDFFHCWVSEACFFWSWRYHTIIMTSSHWWPWIFMPFKLLAITTFYRRKLHRLIMCRLSRLPGKSTCVCCSHTSGELHVTQDNPNIALSGIAGLKINCFCTKTSNAKYITVPPQRYQDRCCSIYIDNSDQWWILMIHRGFIWIF